MQQISLTDAALDLLSLIEAAQNGEEIILTQAQSLSVNSEGQGELFSSTSCRTLLYKGSAIQNPASLINASNKGLTPTIKPYSVLRLKCDR